MEAILFTLLAIVILLVLSALFSGSETALTAASRAHMHQLARQGDQKAKLVNQLRERKEQMIGALLLGNNAVNILASALATSLSIHLFGDSGVAFATAILTPLVVILAEITPKIYALSHADRCALQVAAPVRIMVVVLGPITTLLHSTAKWLLGRRLQSPEEAESSAISPENKAELRGAVELFLQEEQEERDMIRSILDLRDITVEGIMTHRKNAVVLDVTKPGECTRTVLESVFSRLPVCEGNFETILGIVHTKDLLHSMLSQSDSYAAEVSVEDIKRAIAPAWFIPEGTSLFGQLQAFRQRREHFALVVDEYGGLNGIVTLEDILEEIVGQIEDEHDIAALEVLPEPDGSYLVDGGMTIRDFNRDFDWSLPDGRASTLAGLVLRESRCIPDEGQVFNFYDFRFEIIKRNRYQLTSLRVTPPLRG